MKSPTRIILLAMSLALSIGIQAYAGPRDDLAHAYTLLKMANHDYAGHRANAMHQLELAGHELGVKFEAPGSAHEKQLKSDEQLSSARKIISDTRDKLDAKDRDRVMVHLDKAIVEIDAALKVR